jgi:sugar/nucleoside kinase (ribokinase family)
LTVVVVGDVMTDIVVRPHGPIAPASDTASSIVFTPGGSATSQAVWLARAGSGGVEVHLVAAVGDDVQAVAAERSVLDAQVRPHFAPIPGRSTGAVVSVVDADGQRTMLTDRGANLALRPEHLPDELFVAGAHLHLSGYALLDAETRPVGLAALALAAARGMTRSVDACSAGPLERCGAATFLGWVDGVDLVLANEEEAAVLAPAGAPAGPEGVARALARHAAAVVLTLGAAGALYLGAGGRVVTAPGRDVNVVDTTGAGDAFTGAFLAAWLTGAPPGTALDTGVETAAGVVSSLGARAWR